MNIAENNKLPELEVKIDTSDRYFFERLFEIP